MTAKIVRRPAGAECASILATLPDWFGLPASNAAYAEAAEQGPSWVAEQAGEVGFEGLEEFTEIWGPANPCLIMVRPV